MDEATVLSLWPLGLSQLLYLQSKSEELRRLIGLVMNSHALSISAATEVNQLVSAAEG